MAPTDACFCPSADLERLRLVVPAQSAFEVDGTLFVPLDRLPGVSYRVDLAALTLSMDIPPGLFASKSLDPLRASVFHEPDPGRGAYLDYDVQIQDSSGTTSLNGFAGLSAFHDWAVGVATFTGVDSGGGDSYLARLDTAVFADRPDRMQTWRIGDSYTRAGAWGRPVRFAGAQWQTKFSTQPGFVTTPTLRLDGETALPSTLEVYADNMLRFSSEIPPGPFEIPDLPLLVGGGEIRMVVRDVLGRETIVQQPYYSASGLLRPGLDNFSIEAGVIRRGYGSDDDRYAGSIAAATWRRGITEHLTLEGRAEANDDGGAAGAAVTASLGTIGSIDAFAAASATETEGHTLGLSLRRQRRGFTIGCEGRTTSRGFFAAGFDDRSRFERDRLSALATMTLGRSSLSASYVTQTFYKDAEDLSFASL
ncbi:MAG: fimbrial biogenesis outer membrane usher protein, partial [Acidobacteria bacterium]|nr:fimbrial biogenesis outer membrane usher protein [Acidobacteriota bacterium]